MEPCKCKNNQMNNNIQLQEALEGVKQAVQGEKEDELFYDYLISLAPTKEEKEIIGSIRDDERRHNKLFRRIYKDFTGMEVPMEEEKTFEKPKSYLDGIKRALFGELRAVERYRAIRRGLPSGLYRDILFDIITDELKHASKYNYLFALNNSMNAPVVERKSMEQGTSNFTPDEWINYITPVVNKALAESEEGRNPEHLCQKFILIGVLIGLGKKPKEACEQVEDWENTGTCKLLVMSKMSRYFDF